MKSVEISVTVLYVEAKAYRCILSL